MAIRHGRRGYSAGCRCDECRAAQRAYMHQYRERVSLGTTRLTVADLPQLEPERGPVEHAVESELAGLPAVQLRPSLAAIATAMARLLDGRVPIPKPGAAKVLVNVMDTLHKGSAQARRGNLALVREMTKEGGA